MRSVADNLRDDTRRRDLAKTPAERVDQALRLGDADCELAAASRGLPLTEARRSSRPRSATPPDAVSLSREPAGVTLLAYVTSQLAANRSSSR